MRLRGIFPAALTAALLSGVPMASASRSFDGRDLCRQLARLEAFPASLEITLAFPDGSREAFRLTPSDILPAALQAQYGPIRSYSGMGLNRRDARIALTEYRGEVQVSILSGPIREDFSVAPDGAVTVQAPAGMPDIGGDEGIDPSQKAYASPAAAKVSAASRDCLGGETPCYAMGDTLFVYRWAMALEGSTNKIVADGTVAGGLAFVTGMVNRLNLTWMRDLSSKIILVDQEDKLIFTAPNNGYFPSPPVTSSDLINRVDATMDALIGKGNWDFGFIFCDGLAGGLGGGKHGVSSQDYASAIHEVGHQWGSPHNLTVEGPENGWSIGGSIMGNRDNTVATTDGVVSGDSYSSISIAEGFQGTKNASAGGFHWPFQRLATGNHIPQVTVPAGGFTIPIRTPFVLTGSATDADRDSLTYAWEQVDRATERFNPNSSFPRDNGPLCVSVYPTVGGNTRYFPNLRGLLANYVNDTLERLPVAGRELNMRLVVRDNHLPSGAVNWKNVKFRADSSAGPFKVLSLNDPGQIRTGNAPMSVAWSVAGTDKGPVNCSQVDILLSTDGGLHFDRVLVEKTPNDGEQTVTLPNTPGDKNRLMVKASANVFFDVNDAPFRIFDAAKAGYQMGIPLPRVNIGRAKSGTLPYSILGLGGNQGKIDLRLSGMPTGLPVAFKEGGQDRSFTLSTQSDLLWTADGSLAKGKYPFSLAVHGSASDTQATFLAVKSGPISNAPGKAAHLQGGDIDTHILLPPIGRTGVNAFTFMATVRRVGVQDDIAALFSTLGKGDGRPFSLNMKADGNLLVHWNGVHWWELSGLILPDNQWVQVALVVQAGKLQIHLNDKVFELKSNEPPLTLDSTIWIGAHNGLWNRNFNGDVDDVLLWDRALTPAEIARYQTHYPSGDEAGLLRFYQFDGNTVDVLEGSDGAWNKPPSAQYVEAGYPPKLDPSPVRKAEKAVPFDVYRLGGRGLVLRFTNSVPGRVDLEWADMRGAIVYRYREAFSPGTHREILTVPDGALLPGVYFIRARLGTTRIVRAFPVLE